MTPEQQQAIENDAIKMFKQFSHQLAAIEMGEHIITNPSDFGLRLESESVSKEEMFEFAEWMNHSRWVYYASDMIWIKDQKWEEGITTSELFEIYQKSKV